MEQSEAIELAPGQVQDGDQLETALVKINVTRAILDKLKKEAEAFPTPKVGDKAGYEALRRHRLDIVPLRTATAKVMKSMREEAVAFQKKVVAKEKEITEELAEIEAIDQAKEDAYLAELKAIQDEKDRVEKIRVDAMLAQLTSYEWQGNPFEVAQDTPVQFAERLAKAQESFRLIEAGRKAEAERKAKEEQEARELAEANRKEAERLEKLRQEQEVAAAKLRADQEAFERQKREAHEASERAERERLARIAEEERKQREAAEAEARRLKAIADAKAKEEAEAKAAEEEKARLAALAPDIDKVWAWARGVWDVAQHLPTLKDDGLQGRVEVAAKSIDDILTHLRLSSKG